MFIENNLRLYVNKKIPIPTTKGISAFYYYCENTCGTMMRFVSLWATGCYKQQAFKASIQMLRILI